MPVEAPVLLNLDGTVASTLYKVGDWGSYWILDPAATKRHGKAFFHPSKAKNPEKASLFNASKGFKLGKVLVKANADGEPDKRSLIRRQFTVIQEEVMA